MTNGEPPQDDDVADAIRRCNERIRELQQIVEQTNQVIEDSREMLAHLQAKHRLKLRGGSGGPSNT